MGIHNVAKGLKHRGLSGSVGALRNAVRKEQGASVGLSPGKRLLAWRHGFKSSSYLVYDFDHNNPGDYLPDTVWYKTARVNGPFGRILKDKLLFKLALGDRVTIPDILAVVERGRFAPVGRGASVGNLAELLDYCLERGSVILKPSRKSEGRGVMRLEANRHGTLLNGVKVTSDSLASQLAGLNDYLVVALVEQANYAATIFPKTTNTIRIVTMRDPDRDDEPFIPLANHRFGVHATIPADNWSKGGISAEVDVETGRLGKAFHHPNFTGGRYVGVERHPDTNALITGVEIPHWQEIKRQLLELVASYSFLQFVGWDVVVTEEGFAILEGNNPPSLTSQRNHPYLKNPRTRRFFEHHGVI